MVRYRFNDEAVAPHIEELANLGIFGAGHLMRIQQLLKIKDIISLEEIEALRDSTCKLFLDKIDEQKSN